ncbi:MAG: hypothetical protein Q9170_006815 [Blastenia crenularia]
MALKVTEFVESKTTIDCVGHDTIHDPLPGATDCSKCHDAECARQSPENEGINGTKPEYPQGWRLALIMISLCLGTLLVAIDNTIIGVAVPQISTVFDSLDDVGWYGSAYLLTVTALQPTFGNVYKYFDIKTTYMASVLVFEAAPNSPTFIIGRAVAGAGSAGLFQGALVIVGFITPLEKRPLFLGIVKSAHRSRGVHNVTRDFKTEHSQHGIQVFADQGEGEEHGLCSYYVPFYFQAVQSVSPTTSGIRYIAFAIPEVVAIIVSGAIVSKIGYYVCSPSTIIRGQDDLSSGNGTRVTPNPTAPSLTPSRAAAMVSFFQQLGGAIAIPIGNTLLVNGLLREIPRRTDAVSAQAVIRAGATNLRQLTNGDAVTLRAVQSGYAKAVVATLYLALAAACVALPFAAGMEWRSVRRDMKKHEDGCEGVESTGEDSSR